MNGGSSSIIYVTNEEILEDVLVKKMGLSMEQVATSSVTVDGRVVVRKFSIG